MSECPDSGFVPNLKIFNCRTPMAALKEGVKNLSPIYTTNLKFQNKLKGRMVN